MLEVASLFIFIFILRKKKKEEFTTSMNSRFFSIIFFKFIIRLYFYLIVRRSNGTFFWFLLDLWSQKTRFGIKIIWMSFHNKLAFFWLSKYIRVCLVYIYDKSAMISNWFILILCVWYISIWMSNWYLWYIYILTLTLPHIRKFTPVSLISSRKLKNPHFLLNSYSLSRNGLAISQSFSSPFLIFF